MLDPSEIFSLMTYFITQSLSFLMPQLPCCVPVSGVQLTVYFIAWCFMKKEEDNAVTKKSLPAIYFCPPSPSSIPKLECLKQEAKGLFKIQLIKGQSMSKKQNKLFAQFVFIDHFLKTKAWIFKCKIVERIVESTDCRILTQYQHSVCLHVYMSFFA